MDQLVNLITQQTGLPPDKARQTVQMVVGFIKGKLPPQIASQVDNALMVQGTGGIPGQPQQGMGGIGDMFGQGQTRPQ
jgi:hypothetical protein